MIISKRTLVCTSYVNLVFRIKVSLMLDFCLKGSFRIRVVPIVFYLKLYFTSLVVFTSSYFFTLLFFYFCIPATCLLFINYDRCRRFEIGAHIGPRHVDNVRIIKRSNEYVCVKLGLQLRECVTIYTFS